MKIISYLYFDKIDSTNTWVKEHAPVLSSIGLTCVVAKEQTAGHGRYQRPWLSVPGNLFATLFFCLPKESHLLFPHLAQLLCLSCAKQLQKMGFKPEIKWPNDLIIQHKKLAGVLCELVDLKDRMGVALGIGINLNLPQEQLDSINQPAISLAQLSPKIYTPNEILEPLVDQFLQDLTLFLEQGFTPFNASLQELLAQ